MVISGVAIGNQRLELEGDIDSTSCYKAFMNYCIDNHPHNVLTNPPLNIYFKVGSRNPEFKKCVDYNKVITHNNISYCVWSRTDTKIFRMNKIADFLEIHLRLFDDEGNII